MGITILNGSGYRVTGFLTFMKMLQGCSVKNFFVSDYSLSLWGAFKGNF